MAQWMMLIAFIFSLSVFAIPDDGPGGDLGGGNSKSSVDGLSNCLRRKAKEPEAEKLHPYAAEFVKKLELPKFEMELLKEFKTHKYKWNFDKKRMDDYLRKFEKELFRRGDSYRSESLQRMSSDFLLEDRFMKALPEVRKAYPKMDPKYLQKLLSDCAEENDFSEMVSKMTRGCSFGEGEFESKAMEEVPDNVFLGDEKLRALDDSARMKLNKKCQGGGGMVGEFFLCSVIEGSREVTRYFTKEFFELSPQDGCDALSFANGKMACLTKKIIGNATKFAFKSEHDAKGHMDTSKCGKLFGIDKAGVDKKGGKKRDNIPSR